MAEERKFHSKLREGLMFIRKSLIFWYKNSISTMIHRALATLHGIFTTV